MPSGLRATCPSQAIVTKHGFTHDRRFMMLQVQRDESCKPTYKNMHVAYFPEMVLFFPTLSIPEGDASRGTIDVAYRPPEGEEKTFSVPLEPDVRDLEVIDVVMHSSGTKAHVMPSDVNDWFSSCFGYEVILVYLGQNTRDVLMSTSANAQQQQTQPTAGAGWLSGITSKAASYMSGSEGNKENADAVPRTITFSDCAPFLLANEKSMEALHPRLPDGEKFDIAKFRPNIIISGAKEEWEEDLWGEVKIKPSDGDREPIVIECEQNCNRCQSINIDFSTGQPDTGEHGKMLKKMMKDRRVDPGAKWSPIFGRYSFLQPESEGRSVAVGDEVVITRWNKETTKFGECF